MQDNSDAPSDPVPPPELQALAHSLTVVLVRPQGAINLGLVARACANLGVSDLRLVAPECDLGSLEARQYAHHAQPLLADAPCFSELPDALADCSFAVATAARSRQFCPPLVEPNQITRQAALRGEGRVALVFGNERNGLTRAELTTCDACVKLNTPGPYPSYNLSHAVSILLYLLLGGSSETTRVEKPGNRAATHDEVDRLHQRWLGLLDNKGYFGHVDRERFSVKLRRLLGALPLTAQHAKILWGMLVHLDSR